jgi:hypothetical protein
VLGGGELQTGVVLTGGESVRGTGEPAQPSIP